MATAASIFTVNPEPAKHEVRIDKVKYEIVRTAILDILRSHGPMTFMRLGNLMVHQLQDNFDGSVMWYCTVVKLDIEARGDIRRVPNSKPQLIEIVRK